MATGTLPTTGNIVKLDPDVTTLNLLDNASGQTSGLDPNAITNTDLTVNKVDVGLPPATQPKFSEEYCKGQHTYGYYDAATDSCKIDFAQMDADNAAKAKAAKNTTDVGTGEDEVTTPLTNVQKVANVVKV